MAGIRVPHSAQRKFLFLRIQNHQNRPLRFVLISSVKGRRGILVSTRSRRAALTYKKEDTRAKRMGQGATTTYRGQRRIYACISEDNHACPPQHDDTRAVPQSTNAPWFDPRWAEMIAPDTETVEEFSCCTSKRNRVERPLTYF